MSAHHDHQLEQLATLKSINGLQALVLHAGVFQSCLLLRKVFKGEEDCVDFDPLARSERAHSLHEIPLVIIADRWTGWKLAKSLDAVVHNFGGNSPSRNGWRTNVLDREHAFNDAHPQRVDIRLDRRRHAVATQTFRR